MSTSFRWYRGSTCFPYGDGMIQLGYVRGHSFQPFKPDSAERRAGFAGHIQCAEHIANGSVYLSLTDTEVRNGSYWMPWTEVYETSVERAAELDNEAVPDDGEWEWDVRAGALRFGLDDVRELYKSNENFLDMGGVSRELSRQGVFVLPIKDDVLGQLRTQADLVDVPTGKVTSQSLVHLLPAPVGLSVIKRDMWAHRPAADDAAHAEIRAARRFGAIWDAANVACRPGLEPSPADQAASSFMPSSETPHIPRVGRSSKVAQYVEHVDASGIIIRVDGGLEPQITVPLRGLLGPDELDVLNGRQGFSTTMLYASLGGDVSPSFGCHVEEGEVTSFNLVIQGRESRACKVWFVIPPSYTTMALAVLARRFPGQCTYLEKRRKNGNRRTHPVLEGRNLLFSARLLRQSGVPVFKVVQRVGDLVVVAPGALHYGENPNPNVAVSVNAFPRSTSLTRLWASVYRDEDKLQDGVTDVDEPSLTFFNRRYRHVHRRRSAADPS